MKKVTGFHVNRSQPVTSFIEESNTLTGFLVLSRIQRLYIIGSIKKVINASEYNLTRYNEVCAIKNITGNITVKHGIKTYEDLSVMDDDDFVNPFKKWSNSETFKATERMSDIGILDYYEDYNNERDFHYE